MERRIRPSFKRPPVNEVVCGLQFRPLTSFEVTHYGLFWETIKADYPRSRTVAPLVAGAAMELSADQPIKVSLVANAPEFPRVWFICADETCLVQLQPDRFLFNWRQRPNNTDYPRYDTVITKLRDLFGRFRRFADEQKLGPISVTDTELTYINHVRVGEGWSDSSEVGNVFPDFTWDRRQRFLPPACAFAYTSSHGMPSGILNIAIHSSKSSTDKQPIIRLDLTARGKPEKSDDSELWRWFDQANIWIVDGFIDVTSSNVQKEFWKREQ